MIKAEGFRVHKWGGPLIWETFNVDQPTAGEALIRVEACSVGLTVLNCIRGDLNNDETLLPRVPGHELVGRVEAVGPGVDAKLVGQRVMAYFYLSCGECGPCLCGLDSRCENLAGWVGIHRNGGYGSHTVLPAFNLLPLPESLSAADATAVIDAVATPLHVCRTRAKIQPTDRVVIIGAGGGVGIHMVQMARLLGAEVVGLEIAENKFYTIAECGGTPIASRNWEAVDLTDVWGGKRPSVIIDIIGQGGSVEWAIDNIEVGGRIVLLTTFRDSQFAAEPRDFVFKEMSLLGSRYASRSELLESVQLVQLGKIKPIVSSITSPKDVEKIHTQLRDGTLIGRGAIIW